MDLKIYWNKTANLTDIFSTLWFCSRYLLERQKPFLEKILSSAYFEKFLGSMFFWFLHKKPQFRWPKTFLFLKKVSFYTHSTANLPPSTILKKILFENKPFLKKPKSLLFENLFISVSFFGKFAIIWWLKNITDRTLKNIRTLSISFGKQRKKRSISAFLVDDFPSII